jgi:hypothetical protein
VIRRTVLLSIVLAALGAGVAPALASDKTTSSPVPGVPLHDRYVCLAGSPNPSTGLCVWLPLPV